MARLCQWRTCGVMARNAPRVINKAIFALKNETSMHSLLVDKIRDSDGHNICDRFGTSMLG